MNSENQLVIFEGRNKNVEVQVKQGAVWLNLNQISLLFDKNKSIISKRIKNISESGDLYGKSTVAKMETVQKGDKI